MADVVQEKSRGLKFAEQQLLRHGWEHGKGLGRAENGISEAIKVKVKSDKGGVGHKEGEQFTFHWWDHVFNKASSSLQVESAPNGIQVKKTAEEDEDEEDGMISNKKPRKAALAKAKLYGCFVKSATLLCGEEQPEPKSSISDDSSDEEEDQKLDLSSAIKLSDADLMKACGGRTAHKGARHGLTMSAKLARLEQQEAEFMAKYGKKSQPTSASPVCVAPTPPPSQSAGQRAERQEEVAEDSQRKKKKKSTDGTNEPVGDEMPESAETGVKAKKKKQKAREEIPDVVSSTEDSFIFMKKAEVQFPKKKRKHKKRKNADQTEEEDESRPSAVAESPEETTELHADTKVKKKKKKKSSKKHSEAAEEEESNDKESGQSEPAQDCVAAPGASEEAEVTEQGSSVKPKRKKCKKNKPSVGDLINEEALPPKKKKKKSRE